MAMRVVRSEMRHQGALVVSVPQFRALAFVERHPGVSLAGVAEHLGVTAPTASTIVERLVRRRLVGRVPDPEERRRVVLSLTPAGGRLSPACAPGRGGRWPSVWRERPRRTCG